MKYLKVQNRTFLLFSIPFLFSFIFLRQYLFPFFERNVISDEQSAFEKVYIGFDLVDSLIEQNRIKYAKKNIKFQKISQLKDIKNVSADLLIVKDVLHHWPNEHINYFLTSILPNYKYALITNDYNFFASNGNIQFGDFRPINLQAPPFVQIEGLKVYMDYPAHGITKRIYLYTKP
jgi:hypothetical protein